MIDREYHPYPKWEDFSNGMFERVCFLDEKVMVDLCKSTLACPELLWECMGFVTHQWGYSTEHNLTNYHRNRQAWLGQAACCFIDGAPEYITKIAWNELTDEQRERANKVADEIIADFEEKYKMRYFAWQNKDTRRMC